MNQTTIVPIGIDWANAKHDFHLIDPHGNHSPRSLRATSHKPLLIRSMPGESSVLMPSLPLQSKPAKEPSSTLCWSIDDVQIYPVNPAALASYRKAFAHGGGKNDPVDAKLLAQFIEHYREQLTPLKPNSELTRKIATCAEDRRRLVDQRADLANELTALLKCFFPAALALKPARSYSEFFLKFLQKYPSLDKAQATGATRLRNFFHGVGAKGKADDYVKTLTAAVPLTTNAATIETSVMRAAAVIDQLQVLTKHVKRYEKQLKQLLPQHDNFAIVKSLPGAAVNMQSRIIAALGDDRSRYPNAESLQAASGIAPLTKQSGRQRFVDAAAGPAQSS